MTDEQEGWMWGAIAVFVFAAIIAGGMWVDKQEVQDCVKQGGDVESCETYVRDEDRYNAQ